MDSEIRCAWISAGRRSMNNPLKKKTGVSSLGLAFCPSTLWDADQTTGVNFEGPDILEIHSRNTSG